MSYLDIPKPSTPAYASTAKPSTPVYGSINKPNASLLLLLENGAFLLTEGGGYYETGAEVYDKIAKPTS